MGKKEKSTAAKNGGKGNRPSDKPVEAAIGDPRFARLHSDPRFQRLPKNKSKVSIDSRFARMFSEKGFNEPSKDKRGIRSKVSSEGDLLRRYYKVEEKADVDELDENHQEDKSIAREKKGRLKKRIDARDRLEIDEGANSDEEVDRSAPKKQKGKKNSAKERADVRAGPIDGRLDSEGDSEDVDEELDVLQREKAGKVGFWGQNESDEESEDDSGLEEGEEEGEDEEVDLFSSSSSSSESESEVEEEVPEVEEEKVPTTNEETRRLALMNMDWDHIQAVHLLVLMRSFVPKGGQVYSVSVYPSEFGIEQMSEENLHGPKSIFNENQEDDDEDEEGADSEKLRAYEKAKLRYYYAVVECDSSATAGHLYNNCDGLEFERTSNVLDLRYIPDDIEFKRPPRDVATDVPMDYKPVEFETRALQHSNVKLTWDDDEPVRVKALRRNFNRDELNEMDFKAYVASTSESESEADEDVDTADVDQSENPNAKDEKENLRSRYLALLSGTEESDSVRGKKADKEGNIEIKFHTGLDELSEKLLAKSGKDKADETVWQAYLRKKKEKKNARKHKQAHSDSDVSDDDGVMDDGGLANHKNDPFFSHGNEDPFDDPFFNQDDEDDGKRKSRKGKDSKEGKMKPPEGSTGEDGKKKKKKNDAASEKEEAKREQAELELLLLDDHMVQTGVGASKVQNMETSQRDQKLKKKKGRRGKGEVMQDKIASSANYNDPRFASLFTSHHFAIDPTDPQFKKTGFHVETIAQMQRQRFQSANIAEEVLGGPGKEDGDHMTHQKRKRELTSLVRSVKSKLQAKVLRR